MAEVLTDRQLAARYSLPLYWVREQARAGTLPHLKAGARFLFNPVVVAEVLARLASPPQREGARG